MTEGKYIFVPDKCMKIERKHHANTDWVNLWFYKDKVKIPVLETDIKCDHEVTSKLMYQKNTFYKLTAMSDSDPDFEYYYKVRSGAPKNIFKKNKRGNKVKRLKNSWREQPIAYTINSDNKFVVSFR